MIRYLLTAAFLLFAGPALAIEVPCPAGVYTPAQTTFTPADQPVIMKCAGVNQTILVLPAGGFNITYDQLDKAPQLSGFTLVTPQAGGGTAIRIQGPVAPTSTVQGPRITDVYWRGDNVVTDYWSRGIVLIDVWNPLLQDLNGKGKDQLALPFVMESCLEFERSQVVTAENFDCYHADTAVKQIGGTFGEGFTLRGFNLVGVRSGIKLRQGAGYVVGPGHVNAYERCIEANGKHQLVVDGVLCLKTHLSLSAFVGFQIVNAQQLTIVNSTIEGSREPTEGGTTAGMVFSNVLASIIAGNRCSNFKVSYGCVIVGTLSHDNQLSNNLAKLDSAPVVQVNPDAGANNRTSFNFTYP